MCNGVITVMVHYTTRAALAGLITLQLHYNYTLLITEPHYTKSIANPRLTGTRGTRTCTYMLCVLPSRLPSGSVDAIRV